MENSRMENSRMESELAEIEKYKDDSNKYYQAIRNVNAHKPKELLKIYDDKKQFVASEAEQLEIITEFFEKLFSRVGTETDEVYIESKKMEPPFTAEEIQTAARKLKNNKSTGPDEVKAEFIKHAPYELHQQIASLLNKTTETGEYPEEIRRGILTPLAKPPKKDTKVNVRPIILLSKKDYYHKYVGTN